jgi:alpha-1,2-mannosyltransferase
VPDIFIDTMGYAFSLALSSWYFPDVPTGAYVHYPTISTDMLDSLNENGQGINAGAGAGWKGAAKRRYWQLFAYIYCKVGSTIDVVMTNSTWTQAHITSLWGPYRRRNNKTPNQDINVVFPPVAVEELEEAVAVDEASEKKRGPHLIYIAQFRPEKNHTLILQAFASFFHSTPSLPAYPDTTPKLVLIGSVRDRDDATRVYTLRLLAHELNIKEHVEFVCDATWPQMLDWMRRASVGVNCMWNEHFGIGVVEYQAAGLISVVNDSGGPKLDIVVETDGKPTGEFLPISTLYISMTIRILISQPRFPRLNSRRVRRSVPQSTYTLARGNTSAKAESQKIGLALHRSRLRGEVDSEYGFAGWTARLTDEIVDA